MSSISGVNSYNSVSYGNFASGKRIQTAADGASDLAIIQKMEEQIGGYDAGSGNITSAQSAVNIADGALSGVTDYLQRMRELAVQASNGLYSQSDRSAIQDEIDQLKEGISSISASTNYNEKKLLDGTNKEFEFATDSNGTMMSISGTNATLEALGIADFDVTSGSFDISVIDSALEKVSSSRSGLGAQSNALEHAYNYNRNAGLNTLSAQSSIESLDVPLAISEKKKEELLKEYSIFAQRRFIQNEEDRVRKLFM